MPSASANIASKYTGANWTNAAYTGALSLITPNPGEFASTNSSNGLYGSPTFRANGISAGLPVNFWLMNPNVGTANYTTNGSKSNYDALQIEFRRRLAHGLLVEASYSWSRSTVSNFQQLYLPLATIPNTGAVPQTAKFSASWIIPFGRGHALGKGLPGPVNAMLGNWTMSANGHVQSGQIFSMSGVRLVGMSQQQLQSEFKTYVFNGLEYDLPQSVIQNTIAAFSTNASGYTKGAPSGAYIAPASTSGCVEINRGDCGEPPFVYVSGPVRARMDMNIKKNFAAGEHKHFELEFDLFNVFNGIQFNNVFNASSSTSIDQVTSAYTNGNENDPGGRIGQGALRFVF